LCIRDAITVDIEINKITALIIVPVINAFNNVRYNITIAVNIQIVRYCVAVQITVNNLFFICIIQR